MCIRICIILMYVSNMNYELTNFSYCIICHPDVKTVYEGRRVDIGAGEKRCKWSLWGKPEDRKVWTLVFNKTAEKTPIVIIHGLCASAGLWSLNIDALAEGRPLYAIDLIGFGRSSRPRFSTDAMEAEQQHVEAIEAWRKEMNLDRFVLLGHSMGGFISASYALKYPERVAHLGFIFCYFVSTNKHMVT